MTCLVTPRSTLFGAALTLLRGEGDALAQLCLLRDAFPGASLPEIQRTVREVAITLHACAVHTSHNR